LVYCKMSVGSTHHLEVVFVWKQNYILVDEYFFFCCTWIVNSAHKTDVIAHIGKHDYSGINNSAKEKRLCMIH
ncbi:hypothetical protein KFY52_20900, partial [Salmonella enterica subsp. enterica serovar Typhimurium]|nr:hypothetical protein [Salmonella enterica subsp. enterica serovar Typhimurium]